MDLWSNSKIMEFLSWKGPTGTIKVQMLQTAMVEWTGKESSVVIIIIATAMIGFKKINLWSFHKLL